MSIGPFTLQPLHDPAKLLTVSGDSEEEGTILVQQGREPGRHQQFDLDEVATNVWRLIDVFSEKVLTVHNASPLDGAQIILSDWQRLDHQQFVGFTVQDIEFGQLDDVILRALHSGKVLDVFGASTDDGAPIIQFDEHGGNNQRWRFRKV
jgi:hypothetical protein